MEMTPESLPGPVTKQDIYNAYLTRTLKIDIEKLPEPTPGNRTEMYLYYQCLYGGGGGGGEGGSNVTLNGYTQSNFNFKQNENTNAIDKLEVTGTSPNKTSILSFATDGNYVEMATGRTLEEEYMGVLEGMSQEYSSNGEGITVNNGLKARLVGAEIQGNTIKNEITGTFPITSTPNNSWIFSVENNSLKPNTLYTMYIKFSNVSLVEGASNVYLGNWFLTYNTTSGAQASITTQSFELSNGLKRITFKTPSNMNNICKINFYEAGGWVNGNIVTVDGVSLIEGDVILTDIPPFGLTTTVATISNNGIKYPLYASLEDKAAKKQILLGSTSTKKDVLTLNSDGSLLWIQNTKDADDGSSRVDLATPIVQTVDKSVNEPIATTDKINTFSAGEAVKPSSFKVNVPVDKFSELENRLQALENVTIEECLK